MKRDFTYINDIISGTRAAIDRNYKCEVFNLGNHRSEQLMDMIAFIEKELGKKAEINFYPYSLGMYLKVLQITINPRKCWISNQT